MYLNPCYRNCSCSQDSKSIRRSESMLHVEGDDLLSAPAFVSSALHRREYDNIINLKKQDDHYDVPFRLVNSGKFRVIAPCCLNSFAEVERECQKTMI